MGTRNQDVFKAVTISVLVAGSFVLLPLIFAGPYTDPFYQRFTTPRKKSLVVGTSRAAQGIIPRIVAMELKSIRDFDLYNYSFTVKSSPYGRPYLRSIERKIDPVVKGKWNEDVIYILEVNPWGISTLAAIKRNGPSLEYEEEKYAPANMKMIDIDPNPEYVFKNLDNRLLMTLRKFRHAGHPMVMDDGSLYVPMPKDTAKMNKSIRARIGEYKLFVTKQAFSPDRLEALKETLRTLSAWGRCVMVRTPVHPEMRVLEDNFIPDFDLKMEDAGEEFNIPYLNYISMSDSLRTHDANHLDAESAVAFSKMLGKDIAKVLAR